MLIVRLENKSGQELFVVKLECNNNVSVAVCRRDSFTTRQFKVEDLICDTSQIFSRNNAFIFFQKSDTFLAISNDFTSAFDPGCKVWPVIGAVGAWELTNIYKDVNSIVLGEPR